MVLVAGFAKVWAFEMNLSSAETRLMGLVALIGALGGAMAWVFGQAIDIQNGQPLWPFMPISIFLGMGASIVFVFLVANTDRNDVIRLLALALLSGFFWKPVWLASQQIIDKTYEEQSLAEIQNSLQLAANALNVPTPAEVDVAVVRDAWDTVTENIGNVKSFENRSHVNTLVSELALSDRLPPQEQAKIQSDLLSMNVLGKQAEGLLLARLAASDGDRTARKDIRVLVGNYLSDVGGAPQWSENDRKIKLYKSDANDVRTREFLENLSRYCNVNSDKITKNIRACGALEVERQTQAGSAASNSVWRIPDR